MGAGAPFCVVRKEAHVVAAKGKWEKWIAPDGLTLLKGWARAGLTDEDIAANMKISPTTLYAWKKKFPKILKSLNSHKEIADFRIENALYQKAAGMTLRDTVVIMTKDPETGKVTKTVKVTKREIPPDTTAAIFWLKNRKPKDWRDKQEVELSGEIGSGETLRKARERLERGDDS